jgi:hypothetical protein
MRFDRRTLHRSQIIQFNPLMPGSIQIFDSSPLDTRTIYLISQCGRPLNSRHARHTHSHQRTFLYIVSRTEE